MDLDNRKIIKKDRRGYALVFPNSCALTVDEIREVFSEYGQVRSIVETGDQRGYRFVRYDNFDDAKRAMEGLHDHPSVRLCTHGPRKKADSKFNDSNNNYSKKDLNGTRNEEEARTAVVSDGSDWEDNGARSSRCAGSTVSLTCESRSRKGSNSSGSRPGSLRGTTPKSEGVAAPRRNSHEKSGRRSDEYKGNVWDQDRAPAGCSPVQSDEDWRSTRDSSRSQNFDANSPWNLNKSANNQSAAWSGTAVKTENYPVRPRTEDAAGIWNSAVSSNNHSTERSKNVKYHDFDGVWDSAVSSNNHSTERSKNLRNGDCGDVWDSTVSSNNHSTERSKNLRNGDCGGLSNSAISANNHSTERPKNLRNGDCGGVWDSTVSWNNYSTERSKNVRNEDCGSVWDSSRKLNSQNEMNSKTSSRNIKVKSASKSTDIIWDPIKNDRSENPNQNVRQKSASNETVRTWNSDNDQTNKSTQQKLSPNREINLHSRLVNIQTMNNERNAKGSKNNADIDMDDERIPDLVQRKNQVPQKRQEVVIRNASEVIVGNIPEKVTPAYVLYMLEEYEPIAISHIYSEPKTSLRYCHVYFKKDKDALDVELQYDNYELAGKRLIVSRPNRLTLLAAKG